MEGNKRSLVLALVILLLGAGYFVWSEYFGPHEEPAATETTEQQHGAEPEQPAAHPRPTAELETAVLRGQGFEATVDNLSGGITEFRLLGDPRFTHDDQPLNLITTERPEFASLRMELARLGIPEDIVWTIQPVSEHEVRLSWEGRGLRIERTLRTGEGPFQVWSDVRVENTSTRPKRTRLELAVFHYVKRSDEGDGGLLSFGRRSPMLSHGTCVFDGETERADRKKLAPDDEPAVPHGYGANNVHLAAVENVYFVQALAAVGRDAARCGLYATNRGTPAEGTLFESRLVYPWATIGPGETATWRTLGYLGPKDPSALRAAGHSLPEVVDLGFFALIASQLANLLGFIHRFVSNWGLAIILLTVLIRLVLFPLTNLSFRSMARMRQLKPEIDRVNELYKDDAEKKGAAVMELYRKHKINPLSGCLPMVLQLPIWWALYTSLSTNIELYHMPFTLWWTDLSSPDPYFVLPLALGALMHLQQRLTPTTMDPAQAKMMMWFMPIMITVFMLFLPAGLCLYMLTNSALGIGQQKLNEWRLAKAVPLEATPAAGPEDEEMEADEGSDNEPPRRPRRKRIRRARRG